MKTMTRIKDFKLALGVINNIIVCDQEDQILFAGDEIKEILFRSKKSVKKKLLDNFPDSSVRKALEKKLLEVREKKNTHQFSFDSVEKIIFLFPANYNESHTILLSTREQMMKANKIERDLKERVKELKCLYDISNELEVTRDLSHALEKSVEYLIGGFQYPDVTTARFEVDDVGYGILSCDESGYPPRKLIENILVNGETRGKIEVCCRQTEEFLPEEVQLLKEIALMVSKFIEKKETRKDIERKRKQLAGQNAELKQLTEDLTSTNNSLNALFAAITDTIVVIDKDFSISMSNKEEIGNTGKCYRKLFDSENICDECPAQRVFEKAEPAWSERKSGDHYYMLRSYPITDGSGNVENAIEICRNITKEKQMEEQLIRSYKLASMGKLTAGVAHEINNPNTFIRGNINIIDEAFKDILPILDKAFDENPGLKIARLNYEIFKENIPILLEDMMGGADRIKNIVDGLRNFARKDEGLLTDTVDINYVVENHTRITQKEVRKYAQLQINLGESIPVFKGNIQKLEQVFMNLLINAGQAIEHENGRIILETAYNKADNNVIIRISDNGKGIDLKTRRNIFDPFFTTKRDKGGTGLGLSISYGIIQEHHGYIDVESKVGEGTTFTIFIPVVAPEAE
jgi:signal transduction histidine kinase